MLDKVELAARNNAMWCDGMCRAHGQPTEFTENLWICRGTPPRYHSNITTLKPGSIEFIRKEQPGGFKDGFHDIDAVELGYQALFSANWIWMDEPGPGEANFEWNRAQTDEDLRFWEAGWEVGDEDAANHPRQFPPSLLDDPNNAFLFALEDGHLVAGCILNLTEPVVGLSNTFALGIDLDDFWHDLPLLANSTFPGMSVVGYERGIDLDHALTAGFESIGDLRVWVKN